MGSIEALLAKHPDVLGIENERGSFLLFAPEEARAPILKICSFGEQG